MQVTLGHRLDRTINQPFIWQIGKNRLRRTRGYANIRSRERSSLVHGWLGGLLGAWHDKEGRTCFSVGVALILTGFCVLKALFDGSQSRQRMNKESLLRMGYAFGTGQQSHARVIGPFQNAILSLFQVYVTAIPFGVGMTVG